MKNRRILEEGKKNANVMYKTTVGAMVKLEGYQIEFGTDGIDLLVQGKNAKINQ